MGFADEMQKEAEAIANKMVNATGGKWQRQPHQQDNLKTWYNPAEIFEKPSCLVFLGIHPAGDPFDKKAPGKHKCQDKAWHADNCFSYWICEDWSHSRNGSQHQGYVWKAFENIFCKDWKQTLLEAPSFNVCPIRTSEAKDIPIPVWKASVIWCKKVLERIRPDTIICNGNAEAVRSPWAMLKKEYGLGQFECIPLGDSKRSVKRAVAHKKPLDGTKVLAVPHLSRHGGWASLETALQGIAMGCPTVKRA